MSESIIEPFVGMKFVKPTDFTRRIYAVTTASYFINYRTKDSTYSCNYEDACKHLANGYWKVLDPIDTLIETVL